MKARRRSRALPSPCRSSTAAQVITVCVSMSMRSKALILVLATYLLLLSRVSSNSCLLSHHNEEPLHIHLHGQSPPLHHLYILLVLLAHTTQYSRTSTSTPPPLRSPQTSSASMSRQACVNPLSSTTQIIHSCVPLSPHHLSINRHAEARFPRGEREAIENYDGRRS